MIRKVTDVVTVNFLAIGTMDLGSAGMHFYSGARTEVKSVLKGSVSGTRKATYSIFVMPGNDLEVVPSIGVEYIIFGRTSGDEIDIDKILPATDENVTRVKALIAAASSQ